MTMARWLPWNLMRSQRLVKFISYPKTGNTWVRVLLGRYFQILWSLDKLILLEDVDREIFEAHRVAALDVSHGALEWTAQTADNLTFANVVAPHADIPVIMLARHPLDTLLSFYMQIKYRPGYEDNDRVHTFADMVDDPVFGLDKFIKFHNLWIGKPQLCIVRYEDLRADTERQCQWMLEFIGAPLDRAALATAIEYASFESMKRMERGSSAPRYRASGFNIFATGSRDNPNAYHVREGRVGGYRDHLSVDDCARFQERISRQLDPVYGYGSPTEVDHR